MGHHPLTNDGLRYMELAEARRRYQLNQQEKRSSRRKIATTCSTAKQKAARNARKSMVTDMIQSGKTKEEVQQITGLHRATINLYLRT